MEKEWFIFSGDHHKGPYSIGEIIHHLDLGKIHDSDLVWKEGLSDWAPMSAFLPQFEKEIVKQVSEEEVDEIYINNESVVPEDEVFEELGLSTDVQEEEDLISDVPPPLPIELTHFQIEELTPTIEDVEEVIPPLPIFESNKKDFLKPIIFLSVVLFIFLSFFTFQFYSSKDVTVPFEIIDRDEAGFNYSLEHMGYAVGLRKNDYALVVAIKDISEGFISLSLKSVSEKILGSDEVISLSTSHLDKNIAVFDSFKFIKGTSLVPGYYSIEIKVKGIKNVLFEKLPFLKGLNNNELNWEGKITHLLSPYSHSDFDKKLSDYKLKKTSVNDSENLLKMENLTTLIQLSINIKNLFLKNIENDKGSTLSTFMNDYASSLAPILQNLIKDNYGRYQTLKDTKPNDGKIYFFFYDFGKRIAALTAELMQDLDNKKLNKNKLEQLRAKMVSKFDRLNLEGNIYKENMGHAKNEER